MLWKHREEAFVIKELAFKVEKWGESFYFQDSSSAMSIKYLWITWNHLIWPCYQSSDGKEERCILIFRWGKWSLEKITNFIRKRSHLQTTVSTIPRWWNWSSDSRSGHSYEIYSLLGICKNVNGVWGPVGNQSLHTRHKINHHSQKIRCCHCTCRTESKPGK